MCEVCHSHLEYFGLSMVKKTLNYGSLHEKMLVCQINDDGFLQTFAEKLMKTLKHGSLLEELLIFFFFLGGGVSILFRFQVLCGC